MGTNDSNDKFEILLGEIGQINQILNTIQQRFSELKIENQGLSTSISSLKTEIKSDFSSLKNDLKILNVKSDKLRKENVMFEKKLINLNSLMVDYEQFRYAIGEFIGCSIDENDLDFFYRLKRKSFMPNPPIILKFVRRDLKNNFFKLFWVKKELINTEILSGISEATLKRIYISDDMGPETYRLFSKAKELQKSGKVKYCWSRNGKILIRKEEGLKVVLIKSESDLMKFGYEVPVDLKDGSSLPTGEDTET
uniref:FP protein C-terminal domain-containing protein n=1 Tax=Rhodnius prolixus TaxID=13249 RepID=T1HGW6_RHOPR